MAYDLTNVNFRTVTDKLGFMAECDQGYKDKVKKAAELIAENHNRSRIVLLSGPSGSGKTTTSMNVANELERMGIGTHYVAMDDYFKTVDASSPRTENGELDLESPLCLDMELLRKHFAAIEKGQNVAVPKYDFKTRTRASEPSKLLRVGKDQVVIFEGIHALNGMISDHFPEAFKLYISARSDVELNGNIVFKRTWFRLARRMVRDFKYRGSPAAETMSMWANVRRGEKLYISPFKDRANYQFDTSLAYEPAVYVNMATELFLTIPEGIERYEELREILPAIQLFGEIDEELVAPDALIREFIGGGIYGD